MADQAGKFDLAIVGAGPAGLAAAEFAVGTGLSVVMLDEQARIGGQILRQPPVAFDVGKWLPGRVYRGLKRQLNRVEKLTNIDWRSRTSVTGIFVDGDDNFVVIAVGTDGAQSVRLTARRVLIATGCYDLPVALPGWTIPGVMAAGGVQAFIKSQQMVPGGHILLSGTHPLQLLVGAQILAAGGSVAAVIFAQSVRSVFQGVLGSPMVAVRFLPLLLGATSAAFNLWRAGVPILFGRAVVAVRGNRRVEAASVAKVREAVPRLAEQVEFACDTVALCYGFIPQTDLARGAGAACEWIQSTGGWKTNADAWGRSSRSGLYVAGETTGVGGAQIALEEGRLAAIAIAHDAGVITGVAAAADSRWSIRRLKKLRGFAKLLDDLADPAAILPNLPDADTILCRCEDVRFGDVEATIGTAVAPRSPNAVKLACRVGMGLCQGRSCEHALMRLVARRSGQAVQSISGFTSRFPVRPVRLGSLLESDTDDRMPE